jgi:hypothetical protein
LLLEIRVDYFNISTRPKVATHTAHVTIALLIMSDEPEPVVPHKPIRSVLVSSHQDLELWLEESSAVHQKISLEREGLVKKLFEASFNLLASLLEAARQSDNVTLTDERQCRNELERLFLWGDGFGVADGSLDENLDKSMDLKMSVISLLSELGRIVTESTFSRGSRGSQFV